MVAINPKRVTPFAKVLSIFGAILVFHLSVYPNIGNFNSDLALISFVTHSPPDGLAVHPEVGEAFILDHIDKTLYHLPFLPFLPFLSVFSTNLLNGVIPNLTLSS